jgi:predicted nucleotidyltransferase
MALTLESLRARRGEIVDIAARRGARNIRVFGSIARGEGRDDSDVDLIVDIDPDRRAMDLLGLIVDLEDALGTSVHVVETSPPMPPLLVKVLSEAVPL